MKEIKLGNGLRLTESDDMGIFIHYESISGNQTGMFMGNTDDTPGHKWAVELLGMSEVKVIYPAQCDCGHIFLEKYQFNEITDEGNIGFCWCGFCRTKRMVKPYLPNPSPPVAIT